MEILCNPIVLVIGSLYLCGVILSFISVTLAAIFWRPVKFVFRDIWYILGLTLLSWIGLFLTVNIIAKAINRN